MSLPLTALGLEHMDMLSRRLRDAPTVQRLIDVPAREVTRVQAAIDDIIDQTAVQTATWGLDLWEEKVGLAQSPTAVTSSLDDPFSSDTLSTYTFLTGTSGSCTISGDVLSGNSSFTTQRRMIRSSPVGRTFINGVLTMPFKTPTLRTNFTAGAIVRHTVAGQNLSVQVSDNGTNSFLKIFKDDGVTQLATLTLGARVAAATTYWMVATLAGNSITLKLYDNDPTTTGVLIDQLPYTLAGADATQYGADNGMVGPTWTPIDSTFNILSFHFESADVVALSDADRRTLILAKLQSRFAGGGAGFVGAIQAISPTAKVSFNIATSKVIVKLSYNPSDYYRQQILQLVDGIIPAHLDYAIQYSGFIAGISHAGDTL